MAFNYKLIGQVKQAMYKLAAPPAEVTEGKPYVKPPELAPQQPKILSPNERIIADSKKLEGFTDKITSLPRHMNQPVRPKNLIDPTEFRVKNKIPPDADLSAYPEIQKEFLKRWAESENYTDQVKFQESGGDLTRYKKLKDDYIANFFGSPLNYDYFKWNAHHEPSAKSIVGQGNLRENQTDYYKRMQDAPDQERRRRFN